MRQSFLSRSHITQEPFSNSTHNTAESHRRLSEQSVGVTGSRLSIIPNSFMSRQFFLKIFCLVLRAANVPSIKKYVFFKRKVFVTISNRTTGNTETVKKTADARVEGQMANWNDNLDLLYVFPLSLKLYASNFRSVMYNHLPISQFVSMRSGLHIPTSL